MKTKAMATLYLKKSMRRSFLRLAFFLVPLALTLFALPQIAQAEDGSVGSAGSENTAEGDGALQNLAANGVRNTAVGFDALLSNTGGGANTAVGAAALERNTANNNTACGSFALNANTTGGGNTATGIDALMFNIDGSTNTANGASTLFHNTSGSNNVATGSLALFNNTTGIQNTATGVNALLNNNGDANTANGFRALQKNTTGIQNTANGINALRLNTTGKGNTADGSSALQDNTGSFNTAIGFNAGATLTTGHDNIDIGAGGVAGESNTMRIGTVKQTATFITGIRGTATGNTNAVPVVIDSAGQLGTVSSSRRFKDEIKPMDKRSEAILGLKPVTFHYKSDTQNTPQFGLIAEEVAKINPDLVIRDDKGEIYTVRYEAVNAMLLNEFLKEHRKVEEQEDRLQKQEAVIAQQQKQIEALTATVQKVSDQIALSKPAPQLVADR
jgi:Chaperone of endosialidase